MRIEGIRVEPGAGVVRLRASVIWEDCPRPESEVFYETAEEFSAALSPHAHAFLVGCSPPAMREGEQRIWVDGEVCPELREGLMAALEFLRSWYGLEGPGPRIEARWGFRSAKARRRNAMFLTGGVDSLAALRRNRLSRKPGDPGWIEDGLVILGLGDIPDEDRVLPVLSDVARATGITVLPIRTNVRYLEEDWEFWTDWFEGAVLASVAHAVAARVGSAAIASTYSIHELHPHGSHPLLDPCFSSSDLSIRHVDVRLSRFEKTKVVAGWEDGLRLLRVCHDPANIPPGSLNCGACEKCVRTMLALVALGKLGKTAGFPKDDLTASDVARAVHLDPGRLLFSQELLGPLRDAGREDLARVLEFKMAKYHGKVPGWRMGLARLDKAVLGGRLASTRRQLSRFTPRRQRRAASMTVEREGET